MSIEKTTYETSDLEDREWQEKRKTDVTEYVVSSAQVYVGYRF